MFKFSRKSLEKIKLLHPNLQEILFKAIEITPIDFSITETHRSVETQKKYVKDGKSKTMNSLHCKLPAEAFDFMPCLDGKVNNNRDDVLFLAGFFVSIGRMLGYNVRSGATWNKESISKNDFVDGYHISLVDQILIN